MNTLEALEIVLELANQGALEERDADGDGVLLDLMEKQSEAISVIENMVEQCPSGAVAARFLPIRS